MGSSRSSSGSDDSSRSSFSSDASARDGDSSSSREASPAPRGKPKGKVIYTSAASRTSRGESEHSSSGDEESDDDVESETSQIYTNPHSQLEQSPSQAPSRYPVDTNSETSNALTIPASRDQSDSSCPSMDWEGDTRMRTGWGSGNSESGASSLHTVPNSEPDSVPDTAAATSESGASRVHSDPMDVCSSDEEMADMMSGGDLTAAGGSTSEDQLSESGSEVGRGAASKVGTVDDSDEGTTEEEPISTVPESAGDSGSEVEDFGVRSEYEPQPTRRQDAASDAGTSDDDSEYTGAESISGVQESVGLNLEYESGHKSISVSVPSVIVSKAKSSDGRSLVPTTPEGQEDDSAYDQANGASGYSEDLMEMEGIEYTGPSQPETEAGGRSEARDVKSAIINSYVDSGYTLVPTGTGQGAASEAGTGHEGHDIKYGGPEEVPSSRTPKRVDLDRSDVGSQESELQDLIFNVT